jgi:hypothetical protein
MDSLVRYLESQNAPLNITIQLPAVTGAPSSGEPMIVKTLPVGSGFPPPFGGQSTGQGGSGK